MIPQIFLRKGTLTAILHKDEDKNEKFAMIPFHVGYNGEGEVFDSELQTSEDFLRQARTFEHEAREPSRRQTETTYHYQPSNYANFDLGKYFHGFFDENQDALLISIPSDVPCKCAIENYSGHWGLRRNRRFRRGAEVVKIGPRGTKRGVLHHSVDLEKDPQIYFNRYYVVGSTDPNQSFLREGDSGSLICLAEDGKYTPFAYAVREADFLGNKCLCLDLKAVLPSINEEGLAPCFGNCE